MTIHKSIHSFLATTRRALRALVHRHHLDPRDIGDLPAWLMRPPKNNTNFTFHVGIQNTPKWSHFLAEKVVPRLHQFELRDDAARYGLIGFDRCLNMPGFSMDPIGRPNYDPKVQEAKIHPLLVKCHKIFASIVGPIMKKALLSKATLKNRVGSNTGHPFFSTSAALKAELYRYWIDHIDRFAELVESRDWATLLDEFGCSLYALVRRRHQSDGVKIEWSKSGWVIRGITPKVREVYNDLGLPAVEAEKRIHKIDDRYSEFVVGNRERSVIAINFIANSPEVILSSAFSAVAELFAHTWKVGDPAVELRDNAAMYVGRIPKAYDVRKWDSKQPLSLLDFLTDTYYDAIGLRDWMKILSRATNAPILVSPPVGINTPSVACIIGDGDNPDLDRYMRACGEPSGKGNTAWLFNKIGNGVAACAAWHHVLHIEPTVQSITDYFSFAPSWPVWTWNAGDDMCSWVKIGFVNADQIKAFEDAYPMLVSSYEVAGEDSATFISHQIISSDSFQSHTAYIDVARSICNITDRESPLPQIMAHNLNPNPEVYMSLQGINGRQDDEFAKSSGRFANFGARDRTLHHAASNPAWTEVEGVLDQCFEEFCPGVIAARNRYADLEEKVLEQITVNAERPIPIQLYEHPEYVFYKPGYDDDETMDAVRTVLFVSYSHEEIMPVIKAMLLSTDQPKQPENSNEYRQVA